MADTDYDKHIDLAFSAMVSIINDIDKRDARGHVPVLFSPEASGNFRGQIDAFLQHYFF